MGSLRRNLLLGIGGAAAAFALTRGDGPAPVAGNVGSVELTATRATELSPPPPPPVVDPTLVLERVERQGDRYVAPTRDGRTAVLTLDVRLQEAAEKVLERARAPRAAIVVTDRAGRVLALAGRRTADPRGGPDGVVDHTLALEPWAPAASIFKVVAAAAMVEQGARGKDRVCFHGGVRSVMESNLTDSKQDRRCEDLSYGLAYSQNAIIAKVAHQRLEPGQLADAAGFEGVTLSALGGAVLAGTVAAGGQAPAPTLVAGYLDGEELIPAPPAGAPRQVLDASVAAEVGAMMAETCRRGSAAKAFAGRERIPDVQVAGKTGTLSARDPDYIQYSWFVGYAPADRPELTVSVLLGNAELWHLKAHTAARMVLAEGLRPRPGS